MASGTRFEAPTAAAEGPAAADPTTGTTRVRVPRLLWEELRAAVAPPLRDTLLALVTPDDTEVDRASAASRAEDLRTLLGRLEDADAKAGAPRPAWDWLRATCLLGLGEPDEAERYARRSYEAMPAEFAAVLVEALRCCGRLAEAEREGVRLLTGVLGAPSARQYATPIALLALTGRQDEARRHLPAARAAVGDEDTPGTAIALAYAETVVVLADGDEEGAAAALRTGLATAAVTVPTLRCPHAGLLALSYVLLPETRPAWDAEPMGGSVERVRQLCRALVLLRDTGGLGVHAALDPVDDGVVRALLPRPWLAELGLGLRALGRPDGARLVEELGGGARAAVETFIASPVRPLADAARRLLPTLPPAPAHQLAIHVLGPLSVLHDDRPVPSDALRRERARQLLAYLVAEPVTTRDAAAAAVWPGVDGPHARAHLKDAIAYVQRLLEPGRRASDPPYYLRVDGPVLRLWTEDLAVDAWEFDLLLDRAITEDRQGQTAAALEDYWAALTLYRGDFLADAPALAWVEAEQRRLRARFVAAAVRAGELLLAAGSHDEAHRLSVRALRADPWSEPAHRLAIASCLASGDLAAAQRAVDRCYQALRELDLPPQQATLTLVASLGLDHTQSETDNGCG